MTLHAQAALATLPRMPNPGPGNSTCRRALAATVALAGALALAACQQAPPPPTNVTPEKAVATNLRLTATGDFDALMRNRLPPVDYRVWRAEWDKAREHQAPATTAQQKQFADIMTMLTQPDAEAKLAKRLQPELPKMIGGKNGSLPIASGILEAAGKQMIAASPQLGPSQKALASAGLDALIGWARTTDFSSPKKARKAIDIVCATARQLHVQTLEEWRALDYADSMRNYGIIWNGLEAVLAIYDLDVARRLDDARVSAVSVAGDHATVKLEMSLAAHPLSAEWPMQKEGDHWYDAALLAAWRKAHPATAATAAMPAGTAGPAHAVTTAAPASAAPHASTAAPHPSTAPPASHG